MKLKVTKHIYIYKKIHFIFALKTHPFFTYKRGIISILSNEYIEEVDKTWRRN
jgi:hypothetical protein